MSPKLKAAWTHELGEAGRAQANGDATSAWRHLERAHILSQGYAIPHVRVHARMFGFGLRRGDLREVFGQILRIVVAAPGSWLGRAPLGNTGGANVGILTPMAIPDDLRELLQG